MKKIDLKKALLSIRDAFRTEAVTTINELVDNNNYKSYVALITQTGTSAPVATILRNNIGDIAWTYSATGSYVGTLSNAFLSGKTVTYIGGESNSIVSSVPNIVSLKPTSTSAISLKTDNVIIDGLSGLPAREPADEILASQSIEIRVYR